MSLNWNYTKSKNPAGIVKTGFEAANGVFTEDPKGDVKMLRPHVITIMYAMMPCGIREITDANVDKVFSRIHMYECVGGAMRGGGNVATKYVSYEEVCSMVGFVTNISDSTDAAFKGVLMKMLRESALTELRVQKPKQAA